MRDAEHHDHPDAFDALIAQLDRSGRDFERLSQWFLEHDPEYAAIFEQIWVWRDWPGRWGPDKGIDLIGRTRAGRIVAIQAKNYAEPHSITKQDIDTFLSESGRPAIDERLLIATTDRVATNALEVMDGQEKPVSRCLRSRLADARVTWPSSPHDLVGAGAMDRKTPLPHQAEALAAIQTRLKLNDRAQIVMACGTGKTLVAIKAAETIASELTLVLVPTLELLRQAAQDWAADAAEPSLTLKVCSDSVEEAEDEPALIDAADLGPGVTTDPDEIRAFLNRTGRRLVFCTYKSSPQIATAMSEDCDAIFDLAVCDEAHWCAGLAGRSYKTILDNERIRARKRLFFTATPTIFPRHEIVRVAEKKMRIVSMSDREVFGPRVYTLCFAQAIDRELLCPYQVVVMPVTDREVRELIEKHLPVTTDGGDTRIDAYGLATQIACLRAMREHGCRRMVAFHPLIDRSRAFSEQFNQAVELLPAAERPDGDVWAAHVDGGRMPRSKRKRLIAAFSQQDDVFRLLSNVKILSEGVNFPGIDAVTMIDTKRGPASAIQIVGRAVRHAPGKEVGTIVLPVLVGEGEDPTEALARSEHRPIMDLLAALRAADPDLERSVNELRIEVDPNTGEPPTKRRFILNIPVEVGPEFAKAVEVMLVDALAPPQPTERASIADSPVARSSAIVFEPEPVADPARNYTIEGLQALRYASDGQGLWGHVPDRAQWFGYPYEIGAWWKHVMRTWDQLDEYEKRALADAITWLSVDEVPRPHVRGEMRRMTSRPLAAHMDAWVCDFDSSAREELQLLAEAGHIGPASYLNTAALCDAFAGPEIATEQSVSVVCKALLIAGDECERRAYSRHFAKGFAEALLTLAPYSGKAKPAAVLERTATGQHAAGWQTAEPFFAEARHARASTRGGRSAKNEHRGRDTPPKAARLGVG